MNKARNLINLIEAKQIGWDVYLGSKKIDKVFFDDNMDAEEVKKSLVDHDNYPNSIKVKEAK